MGVYKWKEGTRFSADAGKVADELNSLDVKKPESVVAFAKNKKTELHKCFTWEDAKAAQLYRLEEARSVVRSVIVVNDEEPDAKPIEHRAFEYVITAPKDETKKPEKTFMETEKALSDTDFRQQILNSISRSISELSNKARVYQYLADKELGEAQTHLDRAKEAVSV